MNNENNLNSLNPINNSVFSSSSYNSNSSNNTNNSNTSNTLNNMTQANHSVNSYSSNSISNSSANFILNENPIFNNGNVVEHINSINLGNNSSNNPATNNNNENLINNHNNSENNGGNNGENNQNNNDDNNSETNNHQPEPENLDHLLRLTREQRRRILELQNFIRLKFIYEILFSKFFLIISTLISICIIALAFLLLKDHEYDINILESDEMIIPYLLIFLIIITLSWNFYILLLLALTNFENLMSFIFQVENLHSYYRSSNFTDIYYNPFFFNLILTALNRKYLSSNFDIFILSTISTEYALNSYFSYLLYSHFNKKIKSIMNYYNPENSDMIFCMRIGFFILFWINIAFTLFLHQLISETDYLYQYMILFKVSQMLLKFIYLGFLSLLRAT